MKRKFKSMLTIIGFLICICLSLGVGYLFYEKHSDEAIIVVDGNITINYLTGNEFNLKNDGELCFSVTNNSADKVYYYIQLSDIKGPNDNVTYELKNSDGNLNISNDLKSDIISNSIAIDAGTTQNYTLNFKSGEEKNYSGKVIVASIQNEAMSFKDLILAQNEIYDESLTKIGEAATVDEGLITDLDDLGTAYYFRGNVVNNYVSFAGLTWRIVKINGDGSVKLVLDNVIDVLTMYDEDNIAYDESLIKDNLENWYDLNLTNYSDYIASSKFCNDITINNNVFSAYNRITTDFNPSFVCLGEEISAKIGLLTADEVMLAGGSKDKNENYYLYNENIKTPYFTMTGAKYVNLFYPFMVSTDGSIINDIAGNLLRSARPVINLSENVKVNGTGTLNDPYVVL